MLYQIKKYFHYLLNATNQHGVHSPFVFDFVTKCLYDKKKYPEYQRLANYRKSLLEDKNSIKIDDFGSGSRVFNSSERKVSAIAKHAGANAKRMRLLYRVARYFEPKTSLELGTSVGLATCSLALGTSGHVETVEGCSATLTVANEKMTGHHLGNVTFFRESFNNFLGKIMGEKYDLIYFDGNHNKKATLSYFEALLPTAHNDSIWIFDDIYWSVSMSDAWEEIKMHPKIRVTVDCFWLGFVFFRKEQAVQHFKIRL